MIKKIIGKVDRMLFAGKLGSFYASEIVEKRLLKYRCSELGYGYVTQYKKNDNSEINMLSDKYGSDKGESSDNNNPYPWSSHNYADIYEIMFRLRKNDIDLVIECGLGTNNTNIESSMGISGKPGASLQMWRDYFPNARVIGVDIDRDILFSEERIETYVCDQTSQKSIEHFVDKAGLTESTVDIMIDDGLHQFHAGKSFFEGMIDYLSIDGLYVIEDVTLADSFLYKDYFLNISDLYSVHFFNLTTPKLSRGTDNRLVVVQKNAT